MKKTSKLPMYSALSILAISMPQMTWGMEDFAEYPSQLQRKQEIFAVRGAKIKEYVDQYKLLGEASNHRELGASVVKIITGYADRIDGNDGQINNDIRIASLLAYAKELEGHIKDLCNFESGGGWFLKSAVDDTFNPMRNYIRNQIREDILESMNLYKELNSKPHPLWNEFSKMRDTVLSPLSSNLSETTQQQVLALKLKLQAYQRERQNHAESVKRELKEAEQNLIEVQKACEEEEKRAKQKSFLIQKEKINEHIEQYNTLKNVSTYYDLRKISAEILGVYLKISEEEGMEEDRFHRIQYIIKLARGIGETTLQILQENKLLLRKPYDPMFEKLKVLLLLNIKEDLLGSMESFHITHSTVHPLWYKFSKDTEGFTESSQQHILKEEPKNNEDGCILS